MLSWRHDIGAKGSDVTEQKELTMNHLTITGHLGADPELRYTPRGKAVANLRVADTPRVRNAQGEWEDGTTLWLRATAWGDLAEHIASSLHQGDQVTLSGRLVQREYVDRSGEQRQSIELTIEECAASLSRATVSIQRVARSSASNTGGAQANARAAAQAAQGSAQATYAAEAWGAVATPGQGVGEMDY